MNDEVKSAAELKQIRLNRKLAQQVEGIKAMADIAAADAAIRKRTAALRELRLAKEAADRAKPPEAKAKVNKKAQPNKKKSA
ncbi:transcriptional regulator [Bradyrhizobium sp.]|uniref:transcriptional regulator n=1 Tax=Bradyrhizobium sp. TaxID=376 RepID=UPI003C709BC7